MTVIPAGPVVGPLTLLILAGVLLRLHRRGQLDAGRSFTAIVATGYAGAVLAVTMFPMRLSLADHTGWVHRLNLIPIETIDAPTFNLNVAMLIPLGLLLPLLTPIRSWAEVLRWGALVSLGIEGTQFLTDVLLGTSRTADVNDVIANSMGAVFGYAIYLIAAGTPVLGQLLRRCSLHRDRRQTSGTGARGSIEPAPRGR